MKKALAAALALAIVAFTPGPSCYAALAETRAASQAPTAAPVVSLPTIPSLPSGLPSLTAPAEVTTEGFAGLAAGSALAAPVGAARAVQQDAKPAQATARQVLVSGVQQIAHSSNGLQRKTALDRIFTAGKAQAEDSTVAGNVSAASPDLPPATISSALKARAPPAVRPGRIALAAGLGLGMGLSHPLGLLVSVPIMVASLVLHEMGHAWLAFKLGDPTAVLQNRLSFKPRDLMTHIDIMWTIVMPVLVGFGGAVPVPVEMSNFRHPTRDMALVALAGPAVNFILAAAGALLLPFAGPFAAVASTLVYWNVLLGTFNLIPLFPLDGHHVARAVISAFSPATAARLDRFYYSGEKILGFVPKAWLPLIALLGVSYLTGLLPALLGMAMHLFAALTATVSGVSTASAFLPAVAALGLLTGQLRQSGPALLNPGKPVPVESVAEHPVELVVVFDGARSAIKSDAHLSFVDIEAADGVSRYAEVQKSMLADIGTLGVAADELANYNATPIATYRRINAATFRVDASRAADFTAFMKEQGMRVYPNERRRIITPVPVSPENDDPEARGPVSMAETLKITRADGVIAEGDRRFARNGLLSKLFGKPAPQPAIGVVDSGADTSHPLLKNVKNVVNVTDGAPQDDIGHGSWVTSMVLNYAPWSRNLTHYKTFKDGGASLDDILKALTVAGNDGNLVISNSWGSDDGDPNSPDSQLVKKLAEEGHVMVFAAGNAGSGVNTIGSPAIVQYKDPKTGAIRVVAVAAADRNKKIAYFSSRGPGSPATSQQKDYPFHKPDAAAVGYNTEGAWPSYLDADRTDPKLGSLKAISGTSMSTPDFAGAVALLATMFGVTSLGVQLDAVVNALMATLEKTGQGRDAEGEGFLNVQAAYELLQKTLTPVGPGRIARLVASAFIPGQAVARYQRIADDIRTDQAMLDSANKGNIRWINAPLIAAQGRMRRRIVENESLRRQLEKQYPGIRFRATFVGKVRMGLRHLVGSAK